MRKIFLPLAALIATAFSGFCQNHAAEKPGYTDSPMLPSGKWHVHDPNRPVPPAVTPGSKFSDSAPPPADAIVLFDGKDLSQWEGTKGEPQWKIKHASRKDPGYMEVVPKAGSIHTKQEFGDFQLHLEWSEPTLITGDSQNRGNSGVIIYGLYEVQVLDSYNNPTYPDGQCGGLYGQSPPLVNACRKPGEWQTYDIIFEGPRWDEDKKLTRPASVTVIQNGVVLHHKQALIGATGHKKYGNYKQPMPPRGFIELQEHKNQVRYRNIWIREIGEEEKP